MLSWGLWEIKFLLGHLYCVFTPGQVLHDMDSQDKEVRHPLHAVPLDIWWLDVSCLCPEIYHNILGLSCVHLRPRCVSSVELCLCPLQKWASITAVSSVDLTIELLWWVGAQSCAQCEVQGAQHTALWQTSANTDGRGGVCASVVPNTFQELDIDQQFIFKIFNNKLSTNQSYKSVAV